MRAHRYYTEKYGEEPNYCEVPLHTLVEENFIKGLVVVEDKTILPNHLWIGVNHESRTIVF